MPQRSDYREIWNGTYRVDDQQNNVDSAKYIGFQAYLYRGLRDMELQFQQHKIL